MTSIVDFVNVGMHLYVLEHLIIISLVTRNHQRSKIAIIVHLLSHKTLDCGQSIALQTRDFIATLELDNYNLWLNADIKTLRYFVTEYTF